MAAVVALVCEPVNGNPGLRFETAFPLEPSNRHGHFCPISVNGTPAGLRVKIESLCKDK